MCDADEGDRSSNTGKVGEVESLVERWRARMELTYACSLEASNVRDGERRDV